MFKFDYRLDYYLIFRVAPFCPQKGGLHLKICGWHGLRVFELTVVSDMSSNKTTVSPRRLKQTVPPITHYLCNVRVKCAKRFDVSGHLVPILIRQIIGFGTGCTETSESKKLLKSQYKRASSFAGAHYRYALPNDVGFALMSTDHPFPRRLVKECHKERKKVYHKDCK